MKTAIWIFIFLIVFCYFGYPLLVSALSRLFMRPVRKDSILPSVSVVISVYNEEDVIDRKIRNLLELNYPADKLEILIGSDGSTDRTVAVIEGYKDPRIAVIAHPERRGKMATVNELVARARHEIIFFNDARQVLEKDALRNLVANFADPAVGCVSGELVFTKAEGGTAKGINAYWEYEKFIRFHESRIHSMLGATGAIYAIRKNLYTPGPSNLILDDMFTPLNVVLKGYRAIFDDTAHAFDQTAHNPREEHRRKARTLYGNYQIFFMLPQIFNPFTSPVALQMFSHKLLRVLVPFFMIAVAVLNLCVVDEPVFLWLGMAQASFYTMAVLGAVTRNTQDGLLKVVQKICYIPYVFCLLNFSALSGFYRFVRGRQESTWQKARHTL